jgi:hypothetical protein
VVTPLLYSAGCSELESSIHFLLVFDVVVMVMYSIIDG